MNHFDYAVFEEIECCRTRGDVVVVDDCYGIFYEGYGLPSISVR